MSRLDRCQFGSGDGSRHASNLEQMELSTAGGCKVWAGSGSRLLVLLELQPPRRPDKTGARFGMGLEGGMNCPD